MMNRALLLIALGFICAGNAHADIITYEAFLSGPAENPPNASPGSGFVIVDYDSDVHSLALEVSFTDLIGTVTAAHIHCCVDAPGNVGVATPVPTFPGFPAGVTAGIYSNTFDLTDPASFNAAFITNNGGTPASAEAALAAGLAGGRAYFNIHTTFRTGGEIRGFLSSVPEPASLSLMGLGLVALLAGRRKRITLYPAGQETGVT